MASKMIRDKRNRLVDPKTGKFINETLLRWNTPGAKGFAYWLKEMKPCVLDSTGQYKPITLTKLQIALLKRILKANADGDFQHTLSLLIEPRRHGKSTLMALIVLWLICSRKNYTIQLSGNSELHSRRVQFNTLKKIINHTKKLTKLFTIKQFEIHHEKNGSVIQMMQGVSTTTAFGDRINCLWVSDFHACPDLAPFNALQASLLDSDNSLILIDSNVDSTDGHVHELQREAQQDDSIFAYHLQYKDLDDYCKRAPEWINRQKARRMARTLLPVDFARDILGKRLDAKNALFPSHVIEKCKDSYQIPVDDIQALANGRTCKIFGGLDRSKSLFGGDLTIWTVVMKVASPEHGEPEIYILNQKAIIPNTARGIKKIIQKDHERYSLHNVVLENYETTDIKPWLDDMKIPCELVSAHDTNQNASFPELFRIANEGRLHFPASMKDLISEMQTFTYTQRTGGKYSFGHSSTKFHDDRVYSLNWAVFAGRSVILNLFNIGSIQCINKSSRKSLCYLMNGDSDLILHCSRDCIAHDQVDEYYRQFKSYNFDSHLTLPEFFHRKVKHIGARVSQNV